MFKGLRKRLSAAWWAFRNPHRLTVAYSEFERLAHCPHGQETTRTVPTQWAKVCLHRFNIPPILR